MTVVVSRRPGHDTRDRRVSAVVPRPMQKLRRTAPRPPALVGAAAALSALLVGGGLAHLAAPDAGAFRMIIMSTGPGIATVFVMTLAFHSGYEVHPVLRWTGFGFLAVIVPVTLALLTSGVWNAILAPHLPHSNVVAMNIGFVVALAPMGSFYVGSVMRQDDKRLDEHAEAVVVVSVAVPLQRETSSESIP